MFEGPFKIQKNKDNIIEVFLNSKYEIKEDEEYYETVEFIVEMINQKNAKKVFQEHFNVTFFSSLEFILGKNKMQEEKCSICLEEFEIRDFYKEVNEQNDNDVYSLPCSHIYHRSCLNEMIKGREWIKCPVCMTIYGKMTGDMPQGNISVNVDKKLTCAGYPPGTIVINYSFAGCVRNGKNIPGTSRTGYLPNTAEGKQVLELLQECWNRKLTFTVGRSVTTGRDNQIVWNGIHHKTSTSGGAANFGYPDQTYLKRVKEELAAKGITKK